MVDSAHLVRSAVDIRLRAQAARGIVDVWRVERAPIRNVHVEREKHQSIVERPARLRAQRLEHSRCVVAAVDPHQKKNLFFFYLLQLA
jgi:predicted metalloprotease